MQHFDVLVVGAGSAGCALASRLSENTDLEVGLVEAGPHFQHIEDFPPEMAKARSLGAAMPGHPNNWSFIGDLRPGKSYPLARGKVVGGSSAVNGVYFVRGRREDFDQLSRQGNPEWAFERVLPFFVRSETDLDYSSVNHPEHGKDGPLPIRRPSPDELRPASKAFIGACLQLGFPDESDKNDSSLKSGVGLVPQNSVNGLRMNTAVTYLADCLDRPNFTLVPECMVEKILIRDRRALGVAARRRGEEIILEADEVVLCAGGIMSPQLLQLSGIGPADLLRSLDIPVVQDAPVGRYIQDHPTVSVSYRVTSFEEPESAKGTSAIQVCLNHTAPGSEDIEDLQISCMSATFEQSMRTGRTDSGFLAHIPSWARRPIKTARALIGLSPKVVTSQLASQNLLTMGCHLQLPYSRGEISITSPSVKDKPQIHLNYLSDPRDLPRIRHNVRTALSIVDAPPFQAIGAELVSPGPEDRATDDRLDSWITENIGTAMHTSSSARMGPDPRTSVVDQYGRVHGVEGLRVADLSILPAIPRRSPHATAVMIGERVAGFFELK